ncbi:hypothetical protein CGI95_21880 [Vibrio parahaemolyticus]|nr:hypothetical protein CGI95_21880 [Vibrio parahaemolyticus]
MVVGLLSPTYWLASYLKRNYHSYKQSIIRTLNWIYFVASVVSLAIVICLHLDTRTPFSVSNEYLRWFWSMILLSRCSEVFYAFLFDAYDKIKPSTVPDLDQTKEARCHWLKRQFHNQPIEMHHRLVLAFRSYIELVVNFAILYAIQPISYWKSAAHPDDIVNALYFSGVTITTLGYGDITPIHWFPQFLTVYEVLCGFSLIVVCFAVYLSKK